MNKNRTSLLNVHNNQVGIRVRRFGSIRLFSVRCWLILRRYSRPLIVNANVTVCQVHVNLRPVGDHSVHSLKSRNNWKNRTTNRSKFVSNAVWSTKSYVSCREIFPSNRINRPSRTPSKMIWSSINPVRISARRISRWAHSERSDVCVIERHVRSMDVICSVAIEVINLRSSPCETGAIVVSNGVATSNVKIVSQHKKSVVVCRKICTYEFHWCVVRVVAFSLTDWITTIIRHRFSLSVLLFTVKNPYISIEYGTNWSLGWKAKSIVWTMNYESMVEHTNRAITRPIGMINEIDSLSYGHRLLWLSRTIKRRCTTILKGKFIITRSFSKVRDNEINFNCSATTEEIDHFGTVSTFFVVDADGGGEGVEFDQPLLFLHSLERR